MSGEILVASVIATVTLLLIAAIAAIIMKKVNFPYTIGLVIVGITLAALAHNFKALDFLDHVRLTPEMILYILLPTLIFEASVNIDTRLLMKNIMPVLILAAPGLVISTAIVGLAVMVSTPLGLGAAMLFGALISATDPVAVIALFKTLGAPKRLTMLVDGESLFNDATAIVMFNIVLGMIISGATLSLNSLFSGSLNFIFVFAGGLLAGALVGFIMVRIINLAGNDPLIEVAISTVIAYTAFIVADHFLKVSGVMSVMGAGIVFSWYGTTRFTPEVKEYLKQFWEFAAFIANSFIFLLLGFTEKFLIEGIFDINHVGLLKYVGFAILAVLIARLVVVFGLVPLIGKIPKEEKINWKYQAVIFWGGLRGAVPMALVLSLPYDFGGTLKIDGLNLTVRQLIIEITLGVVLFTLLIQGTSMSWVMRKLGLDKKSLFDQLAHLQALLGINKTAETKIKEFEQTGFFSEDIIKRYRDHYESERGKIAEEFNQLKKTPEFNREAGQAIIWTQAFAIEKMTCLDFFEKGIISEPIAKEFILNIDIQADLVMKGQTPTLMNTYVPLEMKIERILFNLFKTIMPKAAFVKRHKIRSLSLSYEEAAAMFIFPIPIKEHLLQLKELFPSLEKEIDECLKLYFDRKAKAKEQLQYLETQYPKLSTQVKELSMFGAILNSEEETLNDLMTTGKVPEAVVLEIKEDLDKAIFQAKTKKRLPSI
jgi:CPA1 family monovalent cation:H+ antiporter